MRQRISRCMFPLSVCLSVCLSVGVLAGDFLLDDKECARAQEAIENSHSLSCESNLKAHGYEEAVAKIRERVAWKGIIKDIQHVVNFDISRSTAL